VSLLILLETCNSAAQGACFCRGLHVQLIAAATAAATAANLFASTFCQTNIMCHVEANVTFCPPSCWKSSWLHNLQWPSVAALSKDPSGQDQSIVEKAMDSPTLMAWAKTKSHAWSRNCILAHPHNIHR